MSYKKIKEFCEGADDELYLLIRNIRGSNGIGTSIGCRGGGTVGSTKSGLETTVECVTGSCQHRGFRKTIKTPTT